MPLPFTRPLLAASLACATLLSLTACEKAPVRPDPAVADLVGDWTAVALVVIRVEEPTDSVDILEQGASFSLNIQPSGGYTSSLVFQGNAYPELGEVEVDGDRLILHVQIAPTGPRVDTARYELTGDRLRLEGSTFFDFNLDGLVEPADLAATLER